MNYKKNLIATFVFFCSIATHHTTSTILTASQYKPDSFLQKPYFIQDGFCNISSIFSGGFASQAFDSTGNKVTYLQQFGSENLLKKFTDASLPSNDTDSFGQGLLTGEFHVREIILSCYKNMVHGFFIEGATAIQDLNINEISVEFVPSPLQLTDEQINYLHELQQKLPTSLALSGMFTTAVYAGYNKTYTDFTHLDFVDFTVKAGLTTPQAMKNTNTSIMQLPFNENANFGYPVIAAASIGIFDWVTIGYNGSVTPWQSTTKTMPLNTSSSGNTLLVSQSGIATIERGPLITSAIYFEADHFYQGFSGTVAYCYTKNCAYTITPIDQTQFPQAAVNQSPLFNAWSLGSVYLQFDIDFACESTPSAPVITVFCNIPVVGKFCPKTNVLGGSCSLQLSYIF